MVEEKQRQIENHAYHGGSDSRQRPRELEVAVRGFDQRATRQNKQERGQEGEPRHQRGRHRTGEEQGVRTEQHFHVTADKADEGHHHDERPWCRFTERQAVDHLRGCEPAIMSDRSLVYIRQHRIGSAKGQQCGLGKEPAHLRECVMPAVDGIQQSHRHSPQ